MKFPTKLNELDIIDLLNEYHSELRKMKQKMVFVKSKIAELEGLLEGVKSKTKRQIIEDTIDELDTDSEFSSKVEVQEPKVPAKRGPKPKAKPEDQKEEPKSKQRRKRQLSTFDLLLIDSLREKGKALSSGELYDALEVKVKDAGLFESEDKLRFKLNQILVKLANKRGEIVKVPYPGRGFAYALPEWCDNKGKLLKEFKYEVEKKPQKQTVRKKETAKKAATTATGKKRGRRPKVAQQVEEMPPTPIETTE